MPSQSRNISEQEHSIKQRSHALFVEPSQPAEGIQADQAVPGLFARDARPAFLAAHQGDLLVLGVIVAVLFLAALWRISRSSSEVRQAKTALRDGCDRRRFRSITEASLRGGPASSARP